MFNIYLFTIVTSHYSEDNIDVQIYSSNYHLAFEILVMLYPNCDVRCMIYDFRILSEDVEETQLLQTNNDN